MPINNKGSNEEVRPEPDDPGKLTSMLKALTNHKEDADGLSDLLGDPEPEFSDADDPNRSTGVEEVARRVRATDFESPQSASLEDNFSSLTGNDGQSVEPNQKDNLSTSGSPTEAGESEEPVVALEAQVQELVAVTDDDWKQSAQAAADDVQKRFVALEAEIEALHRERDSLERQIASMNELRANNIRMLRSEIISNFIVALIFSGLFAMLLSYKYKWPI